MEGGDAFKRFGEHIGAVVGDLEHIDADEALRFSEIGDRRKETKTKSKANEV